MNKLPICLACVLLSACLSDTVCNLVCCLYVQEIYVPVPQCVVGRSGEAGDGAAGNERQIHQNEEVASSRESDAKGERAPTERFIESMKEKQPLRLCVKSERDKM